MLSMNGHRLATFLKHFSYSSYNWVFRIITLKLYLEYNMHTQSFRTYGNKTRQLRYYYYYYFYKTLKVKKWLRLMFWLDPHFILDYIIPCHLAAPNYITVYIFVTVWNIMKEKQSIWLKPFLPFWKILMSSFDVRCECCSDL